MKASEAGNIREIQRLLRFRAEIERINYMSKSDARTALMQAARYGHSDACKVLIFAGANPDLMDSDGNTAVQLATKHGFSSCAARFPKIISEKRDKEVQDQIDNVDMRRLSISSMPQMGGVDIMTMCGTWKDQNGIIQEVDECGEVTLKRTFASKREIVPLVPMMKMGALTVGMKFRNGNELWIVQGKSDFRVVEWSNGMKWMALF